MVAGIRLLVLWILFPHYVPHIQETVVRPLGKVMSNVIELMFYPHLAKLLISCYVDIVISIAYVPTSCFMMWIYM